MTRRTLGPFETSGDAIAAFRPEDSPYTGRHALYALLDEVLLGAGVEMGRWDWHVVDWLAALDRPTVAVIAGWISRATHPAEEDPPAS